MILKFLILIFAALTFVRGQHIKGEDFKAGCCTCDEDCEKKCEEEHECTEDWCLGFIQSAKCEFESGSDEKGKCFCRKVYCKPTNPCQNGGTCIGEGENCGCECREGFSGTFCEHSEGASCTIMLNGPTINMGTIYKTIGNSNCWNTTNGLGRVKTCHLDHGATMTLPSSFDCVAFVMMPQAQHSPNADGLEISCDNGVVTTGSHTGTIVVHCPSANVPDGSDCSGMLNANNGSAPINLLHRAMLYDPTIADLVNTGCEDHSLKFTTTSGLCLVVDDLTSSNDENEDIKSNGFLFSECFDGVTSLAITASSVTKRSPDFDPSSGDLVFASASHGYFLVAHNINSVNCGDN